ncbi:MAG: acyltransferase [Deltaproteobacteria bacterium]|nr:MAG: acyltransferase [Deltaproteobacteria bacterium]
MFGTLRFALAAAVLFSHTFPFPYLNVGVSAVVVFYMISGYVMTGLVYRHYSTLKAIPTFYIDRLLRIYPQYLFILGVIWLGWASGISYRPTNFATTSVQDIVANLTIVPLNFFMYVPEWGKAYIPPAWSLGAELQFYALIPLILLLRLRAVSLVISLGIFSLASFQVLATNTHSFRLLTGALFMFLMGSMLYDQQKGDKSLKRPLHGVFVFCVVLLVALLATKRLSLAQGSHSIFFGILVGFPVFAYLSKKPRQEWDERWGDLSYGLFLSHFAVIWFLERWDFFRVGRESYPQMWKVVGVFFLKLVLVFVGSLVLAYVGFKWVESPILKLRKRLRKAKAE